MITNIITSNFEEIIQRAFELYLYTLFVQLVEIHLLLK